MERQVEHSLPDFLGDQVLYCDKFAISRIRHCFVLLARNLKFYEFCQKELVSSVDLAKTCLQKVSQHAQNYKGPKGKLLESVNTRTTDSLLDTGKCMGLMEATVLQPTVLLEEKSTIDENVRFGKYVFRNFDVKKIYFLIHCWDKLVVLLRLVNNSAEINIPSQGYVVVDQYEDIKCFRIVHGKEKFEAVLELQFKNGDIKCTDFQRYETQGGGESAGVFVGNRIGLSHLIERVRCAKSELQLHKSRTQKEFDTLRDIETFGCNYVRSNQLENKPMLSRCGDIWVRFVANDTLVYGVPLVNNCSSNDLTILKNLKPIFKMNSTVMESIVYIYRLSQLRQTFEDLETLETFFQAEDAELKVTATLWRNCASIQLLPSSFAILLIAMKINQIVLLNECPLFLYFEVEKDEPRRAGRPLETRIYEQHIFLKNLHISYILMQREKYRITFVQSALHQDFLAITMTNRETKLRMQFSTMHNEFVFEQLLSTKFKFDFVRRQSVTSEHETQIEHQVNENSTQQPFVSCIYFNRDPSSLWFGSMALKTHFSNSIEGIQTWQFYILHNEKSFLCIKLLFNELLLTKCKIESMEYLGEKCYTSDGDLLDIKYILSNEFASLKHFNQSTSAARKARLFHDLMKIQVKSDVLIKIC